MKLKSLKTSLHSFHKMFELGNFITFLSFTSANMIDGPKVARKFEKKHHTYKVYDFEHNKNAVISLKAFDNHSM